MTLKKIAFDSKASQDGWEMWQMLRQVQDIKPKVICEIGVHKGGGIETYKQLFPDADVFGIDNGTWPEQRVPEGCEVFNLDSNGPKSVDVIKEYLGDRKIDFLFIDGDHNYLPCKRDFELFRPLVRLGGIIGFHDTNSRGIEGVEVGEFMNELDAKFSYRTADFRLGQASPGTRIIWV